ncbi:alpha/beta-hydrolase [Roridomyces roridus]|uniref:Alpha/beta-hydrolase n=1 Tax=Roridomyces roridus TaxID=1738132 RepID=A0AAD7BHQ9_9AGAR|nr:alpha/beta-hydrolase [Roridomyces roridus]
MDATSHILSGEDSLAGLSLTFKDAARIALVLTHCVGTNKEIWEPVIQRLYQLQSCARSGVVVVETWSMDSPNHGEAAAINEKALLKRPQGMTGYDWGRGIQTLLQSGLISHDLKVVPIGHSAGACILVLSGTAYPLDKLPYSSMILVEPTMMTKEILDKTFKTPSELSRVIDAVKQRKDIWQSREVARAWFAKRLPWKRWDPRVLDIFIKYGLRDLPTASYPTQAQGVTLSCTREQESVGYVYHQDGVDANELLKELCPRIPVHCIFGAEIDLVTDENHRVIHDASQGRRMASVATIEGAGHLITQEAPIKLADAIWKILSGDVGQDLSGKL